MRIIAVPLFLFILFSVAFLAGCQEKEEFQKLSMDQMVEILTEIHMADALVDSKGGALIHRKIRREEIIDEILESRQIERVLFYQSYQAYLLEPALMDSIYTKLLLGLQSLQDSMEMPERLDIPSKSNPGKKLKPNPKNERHKQS